MMRIICAVRNLGLPDCWVGAGFVRNKFWDVLSENSEPTRFDDIDVIYFSSEDAVSLDQHGQIQVIATHGLEDLFALAVRATPAFEFKVALFEKRQFEKNWKQKWPNLVDKF